MKSRWGKGFLLNILILCIFSLVSIFGMTAFRDTIFYNGNAFYSVLLKALVMLVGFVLVFVLKSGDYKKIYRYGSLWTVLFYGVALTYFLLIKVYATHISMLPEALLFLAVLSQCCFFQAFPGGKKLVAAFFLYLVLMMIPCLFCLYADPSFGIFLICFTVFHFLLYTRRTVITVFFCLLILLGIGFLLHVRYGISTASDLRKTFFPALLKTMDIGGLRGLGFGTLGGNSLLYRKGWDMGVDGRLFFLQQGLLGLTIYAVLIFSVLSKLLHLSFMVKSEKAGILVKGLFLVFYAKILGVVLETLDILPMTGLRLPFMEGIYGDLLFGFLYTALAVSIALRYKETEETKNTNQEKVVNLNSEA